jgi:hypothetical protein
MNLRHARNHIFTSMSALAFVWSTMGVGARSVSAQSITVTTPFSFCVNNQAFPEGTYRFTPVDEWLLSIRNVNGGSEQLFLAHPVDRDRGNRATTAAMELGGVTFRNFEGVRTLTSVYDPGSDVSYELPEEGVMKGTDPDHQSPNEESCAANGHTAGGYNSAGN